MNTQKTFFEHFWKYDLQLVLSYCYEIGKCSTTKFCYYQNIKVRFREIIFLFNNNIRDSSNWLWWVDKGKISMVFSFYKNQFFFLWNFSSQRLNTKFFSFEYCFFMKTKTWWKRKKKENLLNNSYPNFFLGYLSDILWILTTTEEYVNNATSYLVN